jgi:hypothetical protein
MNYTGGGGEHDFIPPAASPTARDHAAAQRQRLTQRGLSRWNRSKRCCNVNEKLFKIYCGGKVSSSDGVDGCSFGEDSMGPMGFSHLAGPGPAGRHERDLHPGGKREKVLGPPERCQLAQRAFR